MATEPAAGIDAISQLEQAVLLGVAKLHEADEAPVDTHEIGRTCRKEIAEGSDRLGTIREADVIRSLYRLEDEDLVEEIDANRTSPTGKGRPAYELAVDPDAVYEAVDEALLGD